MILLQPHTKQQLARLVEHPSHGVLLSGPEGSGKAYAARYVASQLLKLESLEKLDTHPYLRHIAPAENSLGIDHIRNLQKFLQLKTPGREGVRRVVIIENAHLMTNEAQNALLKALEEPPADTVIILTAPATQRLKQTIYSRIQQITILPASKNQTIGHLKNDFSEAAITKAFMMSGGHAGLLHALLQDQDHRLAQEILRAKEILGATRYERLTRVDELAKQKELLPVFLQACKLICSTALHQAAQKDSPQTKRWHSTLNTLYQTEAALPHNPNPKLLLTALFLAL